MNRRGEALVEERPSARFPRSSLRRRRQNSIRSGGEVTSLGRTSPAWFSQERESSERQSPSRHKQLDPTDNPPGPDNCAYRRSSEWRAGAVPLNRNVKSNEARVVDERPLCAMSGRSITAHSANEPRQVTKLRQRSVLRSIGCRTTSRSRTGAASYNVVENTGLTMSQQRPSGLLSLGRWTAKA